MQDSLEDRIHLAGKSTEFRAAVTKFRDGESTQDSQQELYDSLTQLGASDEEADEFVNVEAENHE